MSAKLGETIAISDLARACRLSMSYFVRAFTNTVGIAPPKGPKGDSGTWWQGPVGHGDQG